MKQEFTKQYRERRRDPIVSHLCSGDQSLPVLTTLFQTPVKIKKAKAAIKYPRTIVGVSAHESNEHDSKTLEAAFASANQIVFRIVWLAIGLSQLEAKERVKYVDLYFASLAVAVEW